MTEITLTVSGPVGCGKSAIAGEIEIALKAIGIPVRFADQEGMRSEKNMTGADWTGYLDMYSPSVVIVEETAPPSSHLMGRHPDQTSPMTVGPEAFLEEDAGLLDQVERLVEAYVGGEYEAQGCAAEHILADIRELRQPTAPQTREVGND